MVLGEKDIFRGGSEEVVGLNGVVGWRGVKGLFVMEDT